MGFTVWKVCAPLLSERSPYKRTDGYRMIVATQNVVIHNPLLKLALKTHVLQDECGI